MSKKRCIVIEHCADCSFSRHWADPPTCGYHTTHRRLDMEDLTEGIIPGWCPLPLEK